MSWVPKLSFAHPDFDAQFDRLQTRAADEDSLDVGQTVRSIIAQVRSEGDVAVARLTAKFDDRPGLDSSELEVTSDAIEEARARVPTDLREALERAAGRIQAFHAVQRSQLEDAVMDDGRGVRAALLVKPLQRVGIYVPGGTASYPSSVLMNGIAAKVAGVPEVIMMTPARGGRMPDLVLAAAELAGVDRVFSVGGAQSIAALAHGTESVPRVDKIVGPGNAWVQEAKRQVYGQVDIDQIAGPSEVLMLADDTANPDWVAADLIAQAEHDVRSAAILLTCSDKLGDAVCAALQTQMADLPRAEIAQPAIIARGGVVVCRDEAQLIELANRYAPEHLGLSVSAPDRLITKITAAGAIFVGHHTPEALGDYNAGVNHVLPTMGTARFASPLSVHDFVHRTSVLEVSAEGLGRIGPGAVRLARAEGLEGHARAVELRGVSDGKET